MTNTCHTGRASDLADWLGREVATDPQVSATAEDTVVLMYTSGTTGKPKGAMLSSRSLIGHMEWTATVWGYDAETVQLVPMPLFHIRSEEHTSELQSLMRISYAVFCFIKQIK